MKTGLRSWAEGVLEAAALLAVTCVPLFVNAYSASVFERDKAAVLIALGVVAGLALLVVAGERGLSGLVEMMRRPMVAAVAAVLGTTVIAASLSPDGTIAWMGSYDRAEGVATLLASVSLFGAVAWRARHADARWRLSAAAFAGSAPVAMVAVAQALKASPFPEDAQSALRVFGTFSNPIFLGAYLMLALILGCAFLARSAADGRRALAGAVGVVMLLDGAALAASDSRGPLLGLGLGVLVLIAGAAAAAGKRNRAVAVVALAVIGVAGLAVFNMPDSPISGLRTLPVVGRFGRITETGAGSQKTRLAIWASTNALVENTASEHPVSLLLGHGPESLKYELLPFAGVNMGGAGGQADSLADRAHNVLLDDLVMTGIAGALARVLLLTAWFATAARAAGLGAGPRGRFALMGVPVLGLIVGAVLAALVSPIYLGAAAMLGLGAGMLVGIVSARTDDADAATTRWLPLALAAAAAAVAVEGAFGIRTVAPDLLAWVLMGLALACSATVDAPAVTFSKPPAVYRERPAAVSTGSREVTLTWDRAAAGVGAAFGAAGSLAGYAFLAAPASARPAEANSVAIAAMIAALAAGALVAASSRVSKGVALTSGAGVLGALMALRTATLAVSGAAALFAVLIWTLVGLALLGGAWLRTRSAGARAPAARAPWAFGYAVVAALAVAIVQLGSVAPVQADMLFQSALGGFAGAMQNDDSALFQQAQATFDRVAALAPHQAQYFLHWGEMYASLGERSLPDTEAAAAAFSRAQEYAALAEAAEPRLPYHAFNRGHVQLLFANILPPETQKPVAANAAEALEKAFNGVSTDPRVALELATARLLAGDTLGARDMANYVLTLTPDDSTPQLLLGRIAEMSGDPDAAKDAYLQALQLDGDTPRTDTLVALAELAREEGNLVDAQRWYEEAATASPNDWTLAFNVGLVASELGQRDKAMTYLGRALGMAPPSEQQRIQDAMDTMLQGG